ncbi:igE-binding protein-like [Mus musculus]|uniref:igE-binding protein-like n=1 Tax=Mus musculus TaxID=10090 RepID=UPI00167248B1|nr:igE-binding protein-like [Mus musculus]
MNSELFSWGTRVPVSIALRGKPGLELSKEIQDSLSEVKWKMFGLEFFLVLEALLFLFTCYQVVKAGRILDEIQGNLSEVKRGERVGAKRKYGTQNKYTGLSKGLEPEEKFRSGKNTWGEIRRKEKKKEKKKDRLAEVSRRYSSLDELRKPALSSSEADEEFSSEETDWEEEAAHYEKKGYQPGKVLANQLRKPKAAGEGQFADWPQGSRLQGPPYAESPPCVVRQQCAERQCAERCAERQCAERQCADSFIPREEQRKIQQAFPVFEGAEGGRVHAPVEYLQIKEIAESVCKYGTNANFTLVQLDRLAGMALTPADWQTVVKAALPSMGKYMEWRALWHETAQAQARANAAALTPEQRDWTFDLLTGQGAYSADQTNYHWGAYAQISSTAIRAWKALSRAGETTGQLTKVVQGPQESFSDFVARMTEAAERIFGDSEQAAPLVEQLIYEQATKECRAAIAPRKNKGLQDWLRVCRELGGPLTNAGLAAAILQSQNRSMSRNNQRTCFNCGKPGHFKKDCRAPDKQGGTLTLCSKCGKGYHRADQCRSVRDIKGRVLPPPDSQSTDVPKNGSSGPRSQGPQRYGNRFVRTQEAVREATQEDPQGWTCVPPPTSY